MSDPAAHLAHPVMSALAEIERLLVWCVEAPLYGLSDGDVEDAVVRAHALVNRLQGGVMLPLVRQAEARGLPAAVDAPSTVAWLRSLLRMHPGEAKQMVSLAAAMATEFAATGQAVAGGQVSLAHAAAVHRAVTAIPAEAAAWVRPDAQDRLLELSREYDPKVVARLGRHILEVIDPDSAEEILRKQLERQERAAAEAAEFRLTAEGDGRVRLAGWLDTEGAETVRAALDPLAAPQPAGPEGPDPRTHARRMADALVELARRALRHEGLPEHGGQPPTVVLSLGYEQLLAGLGSAGLDGGERVSAGAARRLACDAMIIPAILGSAGQLLDLGRAQRTVSGPLRRALIVRDHGCAFPLCDRPPAWCQGHHITHWADGGTTCLGNMVLLCGCHHRAIHHRGWEVHLASDGIPEFTPPPWVDPQQRPFEIITTPRNPVNDRRQHTRGWVPPAATSPQPGSIPVDVPDPGNEGPSATGGKRGRTRARSDDHYRVPQPGATMRGAISGSGEGHEAGAGVVLGWAYRRDLLPAAGRAPPRGPPHRR